MHSRILSFFLLLSGLLLAHQAAQGQLILETSNQGHVELGPYGTYHDSTSQNYRLGSDPTTSYLGIPYFVFDIPALAQAIESVTLSIYNPADVNVDGFLLFDQGFENTSAPAEITLWNYSSNQSLFDTDFNTYFSPPGSTSEWDAGIQDLQSGTQYASTTVDSSSDGSWVDFYLNSDALIDIWNSQGGSFAIGAKSENQATMFYGKDLAPPGAQDGGVDGYLYPSARLEVNYRPDLAFTTAAGLAVPEPSTYGIAGGLVLALGIAVRHHRRRKEQSRSDRA